MSAISSHTLLVTKLLTLVAHEACSLDCLYDTEIEGAACVCVCDGVYHGLAPLVDQARFVLPAVTSIIYGRR